MADSRDLRVVNYYQDHPGTSLKDASKDLGLSSANIRYYLVKNKIDIPTSSKEKTSKKSVSKGSNQTTTLDDEIEESSTQTDADIPITFKSYETSGLCPDCGKTIPFVAKAAELTGASSYKVKHFGDCKSCKASVIYWKG